MVLSMVFGEDEGFWWQRQRIFGEELQIFGEDYGFFGKDYGFFGKDYRFFYFTNVDIAY